MQYFYFEPTNKTSNLFKRQADFIQGQTFKDNLFRTANLI